MDIYLSQLSATATNLTNSRNLKRNFHRVDCKRFTVGGGRLDFQLQMDPLQPAPTYEMTCGLTNSLVSLNDFCGLMGNLTWPMALSRSIHLWRPTMGFTKVILKCSSKIWMCFNGKRNERRMCWQSSGSRLLAALQLYLRIM